MPHNFFTSPETSFERLFDEKKSRVDEKCCKHHNLRPKPESATDHPEGINSTS
jgi:hypothetical protein